MRSRRRVLSIATLGVFRSRMILIDECDLVSILDRVFDSLSTMDLIEETKPISTVETPTEFDMANVLLQLRELKEDQEQLRRAAPPVPVILLWDMLVILLWDMLVSKRISRTTFLQKTL